MARFFLSSPFIFGAMLIGKALAASPAYPNKFSEAMPIPPVIAPLTTYTPSNYSLNPIDFYQLTRTPFEKQLWPNLAPTKLDGYNGMYPGPTFKITRGRETVVRVINHGTGSQSSMHLHGSATVAPFDGWASDFINPGQYKDYYYPNFQTSRTLWYHDHALAQTGKNIQDGQAGLYILEDPNENYKNIPTGNYDIPLILASKQYDSNGAVLPPTSEGDTTEVNGQLWPFLDVEPRKYRFRILNAAATRTFLLQLYVGNTTTNAIPFNVIASDSGYMERPVETSELKIGMAERWEIIVDFKDYAGKRIRIRDAANLTSETLGQVMEFVVGRHARDDANDGPIPDSLRSITFPTQPSSSAKTFIFALTNGVFTINGETFSDVNNRVLQNVPRGTTQIWTLTNDGPAIHTVHIHLVSLQIISRTINGTAQAIPDYEAVGMKDVAILNPLETVQVVAKYTPWDGLYMFHCHNLVHEDGQMMAVFNVTALKDFGYYEKTNFLNPMDPRWAAKDYTSAASGDMEIYDTLRNFKALEAYDNIDELMSALDAYNEKNQ